MYDQFTGLYSLSKTLRFSLIPVGKTEENFYAKQLLLQDEKRAESYQKVKRFMDRYHKQFIEQVLSGLTFSGLDEYAELYYKPNKSDKEKTALENAEARFRKTIASALTKHETYKKLSGKEFVRELLPAFLEDEEEKNTVAEFYDFTTYFTGFFQNRENMYSDEAKSTAISFRCINQNLPKYLDNCQSYKKIKELLPADELEKLNDEFQDLIGYPIEYAFRPDHFTFVLSQVQIDRYNDLLGGYTTSDGTKVQGLNEHINLFRQKNKEVKIPLLKPLFKQILSDRESVSFIPEMFAGDNELLAAVRAFFTEKLDNGKTFDEVKKETVDLLDGIAANDLNGIYVSSGIAVTDISNAVFGNWSVIPDAWYEEYESAHPKGKNKDAEKYEDEKRKAYKSEKSFSIARLQSLGGKNGDGSIAAWLKAAVDEKAGKIDEAYEACKPLLENEYKKDRKLAADDEAVELLKNLLDSVKELEWLLKPLTGTGKEENKDEVFYGKFSPLFESLTLVDRLYDKVRNYLTQKPYSKDKIKLNFENPQFLGGWDKNKERDYRSVMLKKDGNYYLAVMDKTAAKLFENAPVGGDAACYEKMEYKLLPGPNKMLPKVFFARSNIEFFAPSKEILSIRERETFKKGDAFQLDDCHAMIDFYKRSIAKHPDWNSFGFEFRPTEQYNDIGEFYRDVKEQGFTIRFVKIPESFIEEQINAGKLYLFQIYNKDFSEYSHGKPNLHTLYFKMLFEPKNLADVVYKLNGEAEMFFRHPSIMEKDRIVHPANTSLKNKNVSNDKKTSTFAYDIVKDRRFTQRTFALHIPITMNFKADDMRPLNYDVRKAIQKKDDQYVIGIDRGERNLLYVCVIDGSGKIVEQLSLNEIISDNGYKVDYHELLDRKETARDEARKSWKTIDNIKELKEGYMSQVVHKICELAVKYDAVIAMEDLNSGFKNSRVKVEKQVYQKFEKMLTDKLNYLVTSKDMADCDKTGGLLHAYQLTNKADKSFHGLQNGILFYIPAWNTSKIDPTTGFVDLLKPKYTSAAASAEFFAAFDAIVYNESEDLFEFSFDYGNFKRGDTDFRRKWTVCTNGSRIRTFRDPTKNNEFTNETVLLTDAFKKLFAEYRIDFRQVLKRQIVAENSAEFHRKLTHLLALTLQMRNSETGNVAVDYLVSPVRGSDGRFYHSDDYKGDSRAPLPCDADANGAYNIARKVLWAIDVMKHTPDEELNKVKLSITNKEWLAFAQDR